MGSKKPFKKIILILWWSHCLEFIYSIIKNSIMTNTWKLSKTSHENWLIIILIFFERFWGVFLVIVNSNSINKLRPVHKVACMSCVLWTNLKCWIEELLVGHIITNITPIYLVRFQICNKFYSSSILFFQAHFTYSKMTLNFIVLKSHG